MTTARSAATGHVVAGHGVASGRATTSPFPAGTIKLQTPPLLERGVDLRGYHPGTINVDLAPWQLRLLRPRWTVTDLAWTDVHPPETFSFVECTLTTVRGQVDALVYHPHPETKPMHHQAPTVVELLAPFVPGLSPGDEVTVTLAAGQAELER